MKSLAHPDGFITRWLSKVGDFFCLSIVWLVSCLPLITIVPACIALYDSVACCIHGGEDHACKHFFRTFRGEILRGILLTLLWVALGVMLVFGYGIISAAEGTGAAIYAALYAGTMLIPAAVLVWLIPLQSRFSYGFFALHKAALVFAVTHLPTTAAALGILLVAGIVLLVAPVLAVLLPAIMVTLQSALMEKVLSQYMPDNE